ncbi:MAG: heme o synthase [Planctomycetaceae bacterium]
MSIATATPSASVARAATDTSTVVSLDSGFVRRVADFAELCRPRIAVMTMVAVAVGFIVASPISVQWLTLFWSMTGIVLLVAASSILNQVIERRTDARMIRTADRPVAAGRVTVAEGTIAAFACIVAGFLLLVQFSTISATWATVATLLVYVAGYTLLKFRTSLCTTIGAIPGAMPPVLGWLAAGGEFGVEALSLFAIFFVWQFPHFLAIGWIHRHDYARARLRMLPSFTDGGLLTGMLAVVYAAAFVPVSMMPGYVGLAGSAYVGTALVLSIVYLVFSIRFLAVRSVERARRLMMVSLFVLPILLIVLVGEFVFLTSIR